METILLIALAVCLAAAVAEAVYFCRRALRAENKINYMKASGAFGELMLRRGVPTEYVLIEQDYAWEVAAVKEGGNVLVRQYMKEPDADYARRCAEELLEKLSETI